MPPDFIGTATDEVGVLLSATCYRYRGFDSEYDEQVGWFDVTVVSCLAGREPSRYGAPLEAR